MTPPAATSSVGFELVPVIDLMGGLVVHARAGDRARYAPLAGSVVADSPSPEAVVHGLLALHPFRTFYVADLDAILKSGDHKSLIRELRATFPGVGFWVDAGFSAVCAAQRFLKAGLGELVLGSESQADLELLRLLKDDPGVILSLDYQGATPMGPGDLVATPELWPERVIVMTLAQVGGAGGPDLERLDAVRAFAPDRRVYAAGGVRGLADLRALRGLGCAGVLLASALHDGRLTAAELAAATAAGRAAGA